MGQLFNDAWKWLVAAVAVLAYEALVGVQIFFGDLAQFDGHAFVV